MNDKKRTRITNSAAAQRANVTPRTLRRWCEDPEVGYPEAFVVRGRIYYWLDEVQAFEAKNPGFGQRPERAPEEQAERAKPTKSQKKAKPKREPAPKSPMQVMMVVPENLILPGNASTGYIKVSK